jgi:hypothetical protein
VRQRTTPGLKSPRAASRRAALNRLDRISRELESLTERRSELWEEASHGTHELGAAIGEISKRIDALWASYRLLRSVAIHGSPEQIRDQARRDRGVEREFSTRLRG